MPEQRLAKTRATLPEGYQFPTPQRQAQCRIGAFDHYARLGFSCPCGAASARACAYSPILGNVLAYNDDGQ